MISVAQGGREVASTETVAAHEVRHGAEVLGHVFTSASRPAPTTMELWTRDPSVPIRIVKI